MPALRRALAVGAATASLAAVTVIAAPSAFAGAEYCTLGSVPLTNQNTWVRVDPKLDHSEVMYTVAAGSGFRLVSGPLTSDGLVWMYGHPNGGWTDGWVPAMNLTCWR